MSIRRFVFATILLLAGTVPLSAADRPFTIDLAETGTESKVTVEVGTKVTTVTVTNRIPGANYNVTFTKRHRFETELSTSSFGVPNAGGGALPLLAGGARVDCDTLRKVDSEIEVANQRGGGCAGAVSNHDVNLTLGRNDDLEVKIERTTPSAKTWTFLITTGPSGAWFTTYGFTFLPDRDRSYFSKKSTSTKPGTTEEVTTFTIAEEKDRRDLDFRPSVLFHYQLPKSYQWTFVTGLGYDLENVALFGGVGFNVHDNVTVTAGVAIHQKAELAGRYEKGQVLAESLDSAQLVEKTFTPNLYVGVSFRFGTNIFAEREAAAKEKEKEKEKAAAQEKAKQDNSLADSKAKEKTECVAKANEAQNKAVAGCPEKSKTQCASVAVEADKQKCFADTAAQCQKDEEAKGAVARAGCDTAPSIAEQAKLKLDACLLKAVSDRDKSLEDCREKWKDNAEGLKECRTKAASQEATDKANCALK